MCFSNNVMIYFAALEQDLPETCGIHIKKEIRDVSNQNTALIVVLTVVTTVCLSFLAMVILHKMDKCPKYAREVRYTMFVIFNVPQNVLYRVLKDKRT